MKSKNSKSINHFKNVNMNDVNSIIFNIWIAQSKILINNHLKDKDFQILLLSLNPEIYRFFIEVDELLKIIDPNNKIFKDLKKPDLILFSFDGNFTFIELKTKGDKRFDLFNHEKQVEKGLIQLTSKETVNYKLTKFIKSFIKNIKLNMQDLNSLDQLNNEFNLSKIQSYSQLLYENLQWCIQNTNFSQSIMSKKTNNVLWINHTKILNHIKKKIGQSIHESIKSNVALLQHERPIIVKKYELIENELKKIINKMSYNKGILITKELFTFIKRHEQKINKFAKTNNLKLNINISQNIAKKLKPLSLTNIDKQSLFFYKKFKTKNFRGNISICILLDNLSKKRHIIQYSNNLLKNKKGTNFQLFFDDRNFISPKIYRK